MNTSHPSASGTEKENDNDKARIFEVPLDPLIPIPQLLPHIEFIQTLERKMPAGITVYRNIHPGYLEYIKMADRGIPLKNHFGKYQFWYQSKKGIIDAVLFPDYFSDGHSKFWEIYAGHSLTPDLPILFDDVERFPTLEEAEDRIIELLL